MPLLASRRSVVLTVATVTVLSFGLIQACSRSAAQARDSARSPAEPPDHLLPRFPAVPRPDPAHLPALTSELPADLSLPSPATSPDDARRAADTFSWKTFLALNWPAQSDNSSEYPGEDGDNRTVWESWPEISELIPADENAPPPRGAPPVSASLPAELRSLPAGARILVRTGKDLVEFDASPHADLLVDQNGRPIRLETRVNRPVLETILKRSLPPASDRAAAGPVPVSFPDGSAGGTGAIRVQAAWKILAPAEIAAGRFHAVEAFVYTPAPAGVAAPGVVERATVGLVGFHIARKTPSFPDWIWSTFEHVDNCPTVGEPADRAAYNFYDKNTAAVPATPPLPAESSGLAGVTPPPSRSQIVRQIPIPLSTRVVNAAYQASLRAINPASVWQYYELVGTQYRAAPDAAPTPASLSNTTLETAFATNPGRGASCLDCHAKAVTADQNPADYSFLLRFAQ